MHAPFTSDQSRMADSAGGPTVAGIGSAVWQKRRWVALPVVVAVAFTLAWLMLQTPLYKSTAKVLVESQETVYTRPANVTTAERDLLDQEAIRSQVQLILAGDLVRSVVQDLDLAENPEFAGRSGVLTSLFSLVGLGGQEAEEDRILEAFYDRLEVYQVNQSRVIAIQFASRDPLLAARVANTLAEEYLEMQRAAKRDTTREASEWLDDQIEQLRGRVATAERKVEEYRSEHGLFNSGLRTSTDNAPRTLSSQQLSELASELASVRAEKSSAEARARLLRERLESGRPVEAGDIMNSQLIQGLVGEAVRMRAEIAELSSTLGPRHPRMKELTAQVADLRSQIRDEVSKIVRSLEADAAVASERESDLMAELDKLKGQSASANTREVELRALEREAKAQRDLLESMLARYREASTRDSLKALPADARIISRAAPASKPYFPRTVITLAAVIVGTAILALGAIVAIELVRLSGMEGGFDPMDPRGRGRRVEPGVVPLRSERRAGFAAPAGMTAAASANLGALSDLAIGGEAGFPRLVLVRGTGAPADEAAFALSLARSVAERGARVVLLDTGLDMHLYEDSLGGRKLGLADLLGGRCDFGEVLFRDPSSRVHVLPAGGALEDETTDLDESMDLVLGALTHTYDVVLMLQPADEPVPMPVERKPDAALLVVSHLESEENVGQTRDRLLEKGVEDVTVVSLAAVDEGAMAA